MIRLDVSPLVANQGLDVRKTRFSCDIISIMINKASKNIGEELICFESIMFDGTLTELPKGYSWFDYPPIMQIASLARRR